jgi:uncharacterized membrane protein
MIKKQIEKNDNELVLVSAKFSNSVYITSIILFVLGLFGVALYFVEPDNEALSLGAILIIASFILFLIKIVRKKNTEVKVTKTRFIGKYKKKIIDVDLNELKQINKSQTLFGRIIHCGSLVIDVNYEKYKYVGIKNIDKLISQINKLCELHIGGTSNESAEA